MKSRATRLLKDCGAGTGVVVYPPLAVGGPRMTYNLLDLITDNRSFVIVPKHTFFDSIILVYIKSFF